VSEKAHLWLVLTRFSQNVIVPKICHDLACILLRRFLRILWGINVITGNELSRRTHISVTWRRLGVEVDVKEAIVLLLYPAHELLGHIDLVRIRDII
jgi:hypothetical protein